MRFDRLDGDLHPNIFGNIQHPAPACSKGRQHFTNL